MKSLIILSVLSVTSCVPINNRRARSLGHGSHGLYDFDSSVYAPAQTYQEYPIASYDTVKIGTPVDIPIKTEIHTTSVQRQHIHVPVTYTYTVEQPVHQTNTIYHSPSPVYHSPSPVYHAPSPVYHAPSPVYHAPSPVYRAPSTVYHSPSYVVHKSAWNAVDPWC